MRRVDAARISARAAECFTQVMAKYPISHGNLAQGQDLIHLAVWARGLSEVAAHLAPKERTEVADCIVRTIAKITSPAESMPLAQNVNGDVMGELGRTLSVVIARTEPKDAAWLSAQAADSITRAMAKRPGFVDIKGLVTGLSAVAPHLGQKEATEVAKSLAQILVQTGDRNALSELAVALSAVAARISSEDAARVCSPAASAIARALAKSPSMPELARGLSAVGSHLGPKEAAQVADILAQIMSPGLGLGTGPEFVMALEAVFTRLEPKDAFHISENLTRKMAITA